MWCVRECKGAHPPGNRTGNRAGMLVEGSRFHALQEGQPMASGKTRRSADFSRKTKETEISVSVDLDGSGRFDIETDVGFFDHMLEQLSRHSLIDITLRAKGDLHIDDHHTVEDCGIAIG